MLPAPPRPWEDSWGVTGDPLASFFCAMFSLLVGKFSQPQEGKLESARRLVF